ncbi:TPA: hypothetical protein ACG0L8_004291 [Enterobacter bugandensis]
MSTITKERVAGIASGEKCYTHDDVVELARIALASLEATPVAWRNKDSGHCGTVHIQGKSPIDCGYEPLYIAPPAPVAVTNRSMFEKWWESEHGSPLDSWDSLRTPDGYCDDGIDGQFEAWNACRAAMLQGGDGNSPVIPDGWTGSDEANAALIMLDRIETVDSVDDDRIEGIKRIIRALAAAPQQEVKS